MTTLNRPDLSDIHIGDWVDRWLPAAWRPYARLARIDRPVGIWLTFFPCLAAAHFKRPVRALNFGFW